MRGSGLASARVDSAAILAVAVFMLVLCLALPGGAQAKKKKKKRPATATVDISKIVNAPIPDRAPGAFGLEGLLTSTIDVAGKQLKGRVVRDVNITVQTLGTAGAAPTDDLFAKLVAPNGTSAYLFFGLTPPAGAPNVSIGPLTLDDEADLQLGSGTPLSAFFLYSPWAGAAAPTSPAFIRYSLAQLDAGPVQGTWALRIFDQTNTETSNLVSWRLVVTAGKPFTTK